MKHYIELTETEIETLTANGQSVEENIHRAIRLYGTLDNADDVLAENQLMEADS